MYGVGSPHCTTFYRTKLLVYDGELPGISINAMDLDNQGIYSVQQRQQVDVTRSSCRELGPDKPARWAKGTKKQTMDMRDEGLLAEEGTIRTRYSHVAIPFLAFSFLVLAASLLYCSR